MKNIPVIKPLVVVTYEFIRWRRVRYWRSWWKDDVFFRRQTALCTRDYFSFESRYRFLKLLVACCHQRGEL